MFTRLSDEDVSAARAAIAELRRLEPSAVEDAARLDVDAFEVLVNRYIDQSGVVAEDLAALNAQLAVSEEQFLFLDSLRQKADFLDAATRASVESRMRHQTELAVGKIGEEFTEELGRISTELASIDSQLSAVVSKEASTPASDAINEAISALEGVSKDDLLRARDEHLNAYNQTLDQFRKTIREEGLSDADAAGVVALSSREAHHLRQEVFKRWAPVGDARFDSAKDSIHGPVLHQGSLAEMVPPGRTLHHETSLSSAKGILARSDKYTGTTHDLFVSDDIDLALSQGAGGYIIEFDPARVNGMLAHPVGHAKRAAFDAGTSSGAEWKLQRSVRESVLSITAPNKKGVEALRRVKGLEGKFDFGNAVKTDRGSRVPRKGASRGADVVATGRRGAMSDADAAQAYVESVAAAWKNGDEVPLSSLYEALLDTSIPKYFINPTILGVKSSRALGLPRGAKRKLDELAALSRERAVAEVDGFGSAEAESARRAFDVAFGSASEDRVKTIFTPKKPKEDLVHPDGSPGKEILESLQIHYRNRMASITSQVATRASDIREESRQAILGLFDRLKKEDRSLRSRLGVGAGEDLVLPKDVEDEFEKAITVLSDALFGERRTVQLPASKDLSADILLRRAVDRVRREKNPSLRAALFNKELTGIRDRLAKVGDELSEGELGQALARLDES